MHAYLWFIEALPPSDLRIFIAGTVVRVAAAPAAIRHPMTYLTCEDRDEAE